MAKKLFKFSSEFTKPGTPTSTETSSAAPPSKLPFKPPVGGPPGKPPTRIPVKLPTPPPSIPGSGEEAALVNGAPSAPPKGDAGYYDLTDAAKLDEEINRRLALSSESATRLGKNTINIDTLANVADDYLQMLSDQTGLRLIRLDEHPKPTPELLKLLTAEQAKRLCAIPVYVREDGAVVFAIGDPSNTTVTDDLRAIVEREVEPVIAPSSEIAERVEEYYGLGDETLDDIIAKQVTIEENVSQQHGIKEIDLSDMDALANAAPVIKLVNVLLIKAIKERASDIHIEPFPNIIRIRYRVDGVLREIPSPPRTMLLGLVSRLKVLSNINIAEQRLPQDGRIKLNLDGREVDLRVSTMPTAHGEAVVMRVLDKNMMMIGISQIGMTEEMVTRFNRHIEKPNGIILVTGPTGCGKTTTLYAAISEIKDPGEKFITVEDPVEYELPGLIQVNVDEGVGLTFAKSLRSILRQDPDTVLIGEIRDVETAQISIQASLTGHLVFSTLHTNSAAATVTRLIDMGVEPFLITSSLIAVIGQRLVRTICPTCRAPYKPSEEEIEEFGLKPEDVRGMTFFHGEGCNECGHTGYRGRMGLFELMEMTDELRDLVLDRASMDELQEAARRNGMTSMRQDGWLKITLGLTTLEEVARETPMDSVADPFRGESEEEEGGSEKPAPLPEGGPKSLPPEARALPESTKPTTEFESEAAAKISTRPS